MAIRRMDYEYDTVVSKIPLKEGVYRGFMEEEQQKVNKAPVVVRTVKKVVMPWKKFSNLS